MNKIVDYLLEASFVLVLLRCLILGASISDALIAISLVIAIGYKHVFVSKSKIQDKEIIMDEIETLKNAIMGMKLNTSMTRKSNEKAEIAPGRRF